MSSATKNMQLLPIIGQLV